MDVKITSHVDEALEELATKKRAALEDIGLTAERHAKDEITAKKAVDTGRLRNSISHSARENDVYIGTNVEYAKYVELGTVKMAPRAYLKPAATEHSSEYKNIVMEHLKS